MTEIIYIEDCPDEEAPYVYIESQLLRNALITIDPDNHGFSYLGRGRKRSMNGREIKSLLGELDRVGIQYDIVKKTTIDMYNIPQRLDI
jgi:hypothetical protein